MDYRPTSSFAKKRSQTTDPNIKTRPGTAANHNVHYEAPENDHDQPEHTAQDQPPKRKAFKIRNKEKEDEDLLKVVIKKVGQSQPRLKTKKRTTISS